MDYFFTLTAKVSDDKQPIVSSYFTYPSIDDSRDDALRNISPFCFPEAEIVQPSSDPYLHDFVLTDERGMKRYAVCLRTWRCRIVGNEDSDVTCFCVVSNQPRFEQLRQCLGLFYDGVMASSDSKKAKQVEALIWKLIHQVVVPPAGCISFQVSMPGSGQMVLDMPSPRQLPILDYDIVPIIKTLGYQKLVHLFTLLLLEKSVIVYSASSTLVTRTCELLVNLLHPFQWHMVYVPIVPVMLQDLTQAPTPFLMGGHRSWVELLKPSKDESVDGMMADPRFADDQPKGGCYVKFDLDYGDIYDFYPEKTDLAFQLPYRDQLISCLARIFVPEKAGLDSISSSECDAEVDHQFRVRAAFLEWFAKSFTDVKSYYRLDGRFDDRKWILAQPEMNQPFYYAFSQTSMFGHFVESKSPGQRCSRRLDLLDYYQQAGTEGGVAEFLKNEEYIDEIKVLVKMEIENTEDRKSIAGVFDTGLFGQYRASRPQPFLKTIEVLSKAIDKSKSDLVDARWMRGYCYEKLAKYPFGKESDSNHALAALTDYAKVIDAKAAEMSPEVEGLLLRVQSLLGKLHRDEIDRWIKTLPSAVSALVIAFVQPKQQSLLSPASTSQHTESGSIPRSRSYETTDRLILNCNPDLDNHAHIDSNETLDEDISELELPESLREFVKKPVALSVHLAEMITSMFKVVSIAPKGVDVGSGNSNQGSLSEINSLHPVFDMLKRDRSNSKHAQRGADINFALSDAGALKSIKKMPTYESFRRAIVVLRHNNIDDYLRSDTDCLTFWINIRNVLLLHTLIEFGTPVSFQHRITFLGYKPVYNISGHLFSVNEITYGILKASMPLPANLSTAKPASGIVAPSPGSATVSITGSEVSTVHITTSTKISSNHQPDSTGLFHGGPSSADDSVSKSLAVHHEVRKELTPSATSHSKPSGLGKTPLRLTANDSRFKYRIQAPYPLVDFALIDASRCGPKMGVYKADTLYEQLNKAALDYLNTAVECGKNVKSDDRLKTEVSTFAALTISLSRHQTRVISLPQYLIWNMRDFAGCHSNENLLIYLYHMCPTSAMSKYIRDEKLIKEKVPASSRGKSQTPFTMTEDKLQQLVEQTMIDTARLSIYVKEHNWEFQLTIESEQQ